MDIMGQPNDHHRKNALIDILVICAAVLTTVLLEVIFGPIQFLTELARGHRMWEIQQVFIILAVLAVGFALFSLRRWREARRELLRRRQVEEAMRESETNFRALAENANDGIVICDISGNHLFANQRMSEMSGYSIPELLKIGMRRLAHPDEHAKLAERIRKRIKGDAVPKQFETMAVRKDGTELPIEITGAPTVWRGEPADIVMVRDISERKRIEGVLRESEQRIRTIFETADDAIFAKDSQFRFTEVNSAMLQRLGISRDEIIGKTASGLFPPEVADAVRHFDQRVLDGQTLKEDRTVLHPGGVYEVNVVEVPIRDDEGHVTELFGISRDITARKEAEQALKRSEERFRDVALSSADWVWEVDTDNRYTFASGKVQQMLGYTPREMIGRTPFDLMLPDEVERLRETFDRIKSAREPIVDLENWNLNKDGRRVCLLTNGVPVLDKEGKLLGYRGVDKDITERKRAEEELRRSEARYRAVVEDQRELICRYDPDLVITFVNDAYCLYFGKTRKELIGQTFMPLIPKEDHKRVEEYFESLRPDNTVTSHEHRVITPSGEIRWQEWTNHMILDDEGQCVEIQASGRDITERKSAEEALRQSEKHIRDIFDAATTVSFIKTDLEGLDTRILEFSKGAENIFGYSRDDVIGEPLGMLYAPESFEDFPQVIETVRQTGKPFTRQVTLTRRSGEPFQVLATSYPIYDVRGEMTGLLGVCIELSEDG